MFFEFPPMPIAFAQRLILLVTLKFCSLYPHPQGSDFVRLELPLPSPPCPAPTPTAFLQPTPTSSLTPARPLGLLEFSTIVIFAAVAATILLGTLLHLSEVVFTTVYRLIVRLASCVSTESGLLLGPSGNTSGHDIIAFDEIQKILTLDDDSSVSSNTSNTEPIAVSELRPDDLPPNESGLSGPSGSTSTYESLASDEVHETPAPDDDENPVPSTSNTEPTNTSGIHSPELHNETADLVSTSPGEPTTTLEPARVDFQHQPSESTSHMTSSPTVAFIVQHSAAEQSTSASSAHSQVSTTLLDLQDGYVSVNVLNTNVEPTTISENTSSPRPSDGEPTTSTTIHSQGNTNVQDLLPESNTELQIIANTPVRSVYHTAAGTTSVSVAQPEISTVALISAPEDDNPELTTTMNLLNGEEPGTVVHNPQASPTMLDLQLNVNPSNTSDLQPNTLDGANPSIGDTAIDTGNVDSENSSHEVNDPPIMPLPTMIIPCLPSDPRWKLMVDISALAVRNYEFKASQALRTNEIGFLLHIIDKFEQKCTALRIENRRFRRQNNRLWREVVPPDYNQAIREGAFDEWSAAVVSGAAGFVPPQRSDHARNELEGNSSHSTGPPPDYTQTDAHPQAER
ncbi:hypothetical protein C0995_002645 [Termitomyces sp. Mi166|nr:hypothetical protein C0995_002645 [Termitomyces sp. Mi166\